MAPRIIFGKRAREIGKIGSSGRRDSPKGLLARTAVPVQEWGSRRGHLRRGGEGLVVTNLPNEGFTCFAGKRTVSSIPPSRPAYSCFVPYTGFGVGLLDVENRGLFDIFTANGAVLAMAPARQTFRTVNEICCSTIWAKGKALRT